MTFQHRVLVSLGFLVFILRIYEFFGEHSPLVDVDPPTLRNLRNAATPHNTTYLDALRNADTSSFYINQSRRLNVTSIKLLVKEMFFHGWKNYLDHAYPFDDLMPLSCAGTKSQGNYYLTLIDAADTLALMNETDAFQEAVDLILQIPNFNMNINVSIFETTIRVLGGLISSHILAQDLLPKYEGGLLPLAKDLADRLLWAFNSSTGVPYGTVNLMSGIPCNETSVVCTACATTLILEFGYLSHLLDDFKYYNIAKNAILKIWEFRSPLNLLGKHFDVETGEWTEKISGISGQIDSFYEYLWKAYVVFHDPVFYDLFITAYHAIERLSNFKGWHMNVHMQSGTIHSVLVSSLQAFWPGLQASFGELNRAFVTLHKIIELHNKLLFFPELVGVPDLYLVGNNDYPLRPEVLESVYFFFQVTKYPELQHFGFEMIQRFIHFCYVPCGFASIQNIVSHEKRNHMESFFLSETLKYLYLLFDHTHFLHASRSWVFTTEGHPLKLLPNTGRFTQSAVSTVSSRREAWVLPKEYWKEAWINQQCSKLEFDQVIRQVGFPHFE